MSEAPQHAVPAHRIPITDSQREATSRHHEKMARIFRSMGREKDAVAAEKAAKEVRWPTTPRPVRSSSGVICYAPEWDALICVPCQHDVGNAGRSELGAGLRPATSDDIQRIGCCTSCGRDLLAAIAQADQLTLSGGVK